MEEEAWHLLQDLEAPDVLQHQQQVAVHHHEGRGEHGVAPAVTHHPQNARPQEEDERQPADVGDAPGLVVEITAQLVYTTRSYPRRKRAAVGTLEKRLGFMRPVTLTLHCVARMWDVSLALYYRFSPQYYRENAMLVL